MVRKFTPVCPLHECIWSKYLYSFIVLGQGYPNPNAPPPNQSYGTSGYPQYPQGGYAQQGGHPSQGVYSAYNDPEYNKPSDFSEFQFSDKTIRMAFIRYI